MKITVDTLERSRYYSFKLNDSLIEQLTTHTRDMNMNEVTITTKHINSNLIKGARNLGAEFDKESKNWVFPDFVSDKAQELKEIYESDDVIVEVEYTQDVQAAQREELFGYQVAYAYDKKTVKLGGVFSIINGRIEAAGSFKNPKVRISSDTVLRAKLPKKVVENSMAVMSRDDIVVRFVA